MTPLDLEGLQRAVARYPQLGPIKSLVADGLSQNTATGLVACDNQTIFAKRYPIAEFEPDALATQHALIARLMRQDYPTPPVLANAESATLTILPDGAWVFFALARGEDRYREQPVFRPFDSRAEAVSAGAMLARLHLALADFPAPAPREAVEFAGDRQAVLAPVWEDLPRGIIHGDFIKRNLFWQGSTVTDVIDLDFWDAGPWVFDLALSLLPIGFAWPRLFQGQGQPHVDQMRAFLKGYVDVRPILAMERKILPTVMETARQGFYRRIAAQWQRRGNFQKAQAFETLRVETLAWFDQHPDWAKDLF